MKVQLFHNINENFLKFSTFFTILRYKGNVDFDDIYDVFE